MFNSNIALTVGITLVWKGIVSQRILFNTENLVLGLVL